MSLPHNGTVLPVRIPPPQLRPLAYRILSKKYGLSIKSDGLTSLAQLIGDRLGGDWKRDRYQLTVKFLEEFATVWRQQGQGLFIDAQGVQRVITEIEERACYDSNNNNNTNIDESNDGAVVTTTHELPWSDYYKFVDASKQWYFPYDHVRRHFTLPTDPSSVTDVVSRKISSLSTRYYITRDRTLRNENFQATTSTSGPGTEGTSSDNPLATMAALKDDLLQNDLDTSTPSTYMAITQIKNLLGRNGQNFLILGLLHVNNRGNLTLEDPSGSIDIDISQANPTEGLYYFSGAIVLAEGIYFTVGHKFHVTSMTHPPGERRDVTLDAIGNLDRLNIGNLTTDGTMIPQMTPRISNDLKIRLLSLERDLNEQGLNQYVILGGDMFLNKQETIMALQRVLTKIDNDIAAQEMPPPLGIIFFGSFMSEPVFPSYSETVLTTSRQYELGFESLANLLSKYDNIIGSSQLIFVPGPLDPWSGTMAWSGDACLPQGAIPSEFVKKMNRLLKNKVNWVSNPTKLAFLSQEIIIMRDNLNARFKRNIIDFPLVEDEKRLQQSSSSSVSLPTENYDEELLSDDEYNISGNEELDDGSILRHELMPNIPHVPFIIEETRKYVKTILDQAHLSPFESAPIHFTKDHTLMMSPIPSVLLICDPTAPRFDLTYNGCKTINPGKLILNRKARYLIFNPTTRLVQEEEVSF